MAELACEAMEAGALGFSTSRTLNHRTSDGQPTPTLTAGEDELTGIALGMASAFGGRGAGVLQVVCDFHPDPLGEFAMLRRIVERHGGTIRAGETAGGGTTITFTFPGAS